jgi:hypothetical protein
MGRSRAMNGERRDGWPHRVQNAKLCVLLPPGGPVSPRQRPKQSTKVLVMRVGEPRKLRTLQSSSLSRMRSNQKDLRDIQLASIFRESYGGRIGRRFGDAWRVDPPCRVAGVARIGRSRRAWLTGLAWSMREQVAVAAARRPARAALADHRRDRSDHSLAWAARSRHTFRT